MDTAYRPGISITNINSHSFPSSFPFKRVLHTYIQAHLYIWTPRTHMEAYIHVCIHAYINTYKRTNIYTIYIIIIIISSYIHMYIKTYIIRTCLLIHYTYIIHTYIHGVQKMCFPKNFQNFAAPPLVASKQPAKSS